MGKRGEHQEQPRRRLPDATPCWCLDDPAELSGGKYIHSPRCLALRALQGGYDFKGSDDPNPSKRKRTQQQKKSAYIRHYSETGRTIESARVAGVDQSTVSRWRADDEVFATMEGHAHDAFVETLEREAVRRAVVGVEKPIYQGGEMVGTVREYSDTLLIFMMKGERPGKYRDQAKIELTGPGGGPLRHAVAALSSMDDHERATLRRVIDEALEQAKAKEEAPA